MSDCTGCRYWVSEYAPTDRGLKRYGWVCSKFESIEDCCGREIEHYDEAEDEE